MQRQRELLRPLAHGGGEHWAILASLIATCKHNSVEPHAHLADVFSRLIASHANKSPRWAAVQHGQSAA